MAEKLWDRFDDALRLLRSDGYEPGPRLSSTSAPPGHPFLGVASTEARSKDRDTHPSDQPAPTFGEGFEKYFQSLKRAAGA